VLCIRDAFSRTPLRLPEAPEDEAEQGTPDRQEAGNRTIGQTVTDSIQEAISINQSRVGQQTTSTSGIEVQSWSKTFGGVDGDEGDSVQQTLDGGYIITGRIRSAEGSGTDLWLIKTDDQGNMLWDRTYGERGFDEGASVQQTSDGGYISTGEKRSFEAVNSDLWLIKTDDQGNKLWDRTFSGDGDGGEGRSVQQTLDGGYIIMGKSYVEDTDDLWLIKTDANGNKLWDRTFSTANFYQFSSVQQTHDGGYIITGITGFSEGYDWDLCLIKTDAEGNV